MKTLLPIFILYYTNFVLAQNGEIQNDPVVFKSYPKKYSSIMHKNLNIMNRRYVKPEVSIKVGSPVTNKSDSNAAGYTFFAPIQEIKKPVNIPESLYFPVEKQIDQKPRIKKVLPETLWKSGRRRKRSLSKKSDDDDKPRKSHKKPKNKKDSKKKKPKKPRDVTKKKKLSPAGPKENDDIKVKNSEKLSKSKRHNSHKKKLPRRHRRSDSTNGTVDTRRLIAGRDALIEDYPYVISIQKAYQHWCSGALLNPRLAITTANCMWRSDRQSKMTIRAGSRYTDRGGQEARIQEVMKHPKWSIRRNPDNDVALILFDRFLRFSHSVHGADLPNRIMYPAFEDAWVASYGADRRDGVFENALQLQVYHARLIDRNKCSNTTLRYGVLVSENFICLAQTGMRAPCTVVATVASYPCSMICPQRDTGAPAVSDGVIWGLASWGIRKRCGTERFPAMFSYLASQTNMDFITQATTELMSEQRFYPFPDRYAVTNQTSMERLREERRKIAKMAREAGDG